MLNAETASQDLHSMSILFAVMQVSNSARIGIESKEIALIWRRDTWRTEHG